MNVIYYIFVFIGSLLVDIVPLIGPPAWTIMVFLQIKYDLNVWLVLLVGVPASAAGRYLYSRYISHFSDYFIKKNKNDDLQFAGRKLESGGWKVQLFVLLYTLLPLPSTPLFTAAGIAKIKTILLIPAFLAGKFISDAVMVLTGRYVATNFSEILHGFISWKAIAGTLIGLAILCMFLFTNWRKLLEEKKFSMSFRIWK